MPVPDRRSKSSSRSASSAPLAERVVEEALGLAEQVGWGNVRLRRIAERLDVPLSEVAALYRDLDAVANAWFARSLAAMLAEAPPGFADLPARERIYLVMTRWFDTSAAHRRVTGEMLRGKLYPSHPHHWVPMIFSLSRLIQWVREIAQLDAGGGRRQVEEVGLTLLFLITLTIWLGDDSEEQERTRHFLRRRLSEADRLLALASRAPRPGGRADGSFL